MKKPMVDFIQRGVYDELYTPFDTASQFATYYCKRYAEMVGKELKNVWECTDFKSSNISLAFQMRGVSVQPACGDFLDIGLDLPDFDAIVTNPPYSLKNQFLQRAFEIGKPFAFLLPVTSLSSKRRAEIFSKYKNGIHLLILPSRVQFVEGKTQNWFDSLWLMYFPNTGQSVDWLRVSEPIITDK